MKKDKFAAVVMSPWGDPRKRENYRPNSTIYSDGEYFVSKLPDGSYLYFKKIGKNYCAFNNRGGFSSERIEQIKSVIAGHSTDDCSIQRSVECIQKWEKLLTDNGKSI